MASRSKLPAAARTRPLFAAETQKWLDQKCTRRSTNPTWACTTRWNRAIESARKSFCAGVGSAGFGLSFAVGGEFAGAVIDGAPSPAIMPSPLGELGGF